MYRISYKLRCLWPTYMSFIWSLRKLTFVNKPDTFSRQYEIQYQFGGWSNEIIQKNPLIRKMNWRKGIGNTLDKTTWTPCVHGSFGYWISGQNKYTDVRHMQVMLIGREHTVQPRDLYISDFPRLIHVILTKRNCGRTSNKNSRTISLHTKFPWTSDLGCQNCHEPTSYRDGPLWHEFCSTSRVVAVQIKKQVMN